MRIDEQIRAASDGPVGSATLESGGRALPSARASWIANAYAGGGNK
ncbi:hypothetical protein [Nonomuraea sp. NPDC049784]